MFLAGLASGSIWAKVSSDTVRRAFFFFFLRPIIARRKSTVGLCAHKEQSTSVRTEFAEERVAAAAAAASLCLFSLSKPQSLFDRRSIHMGFSAFNLS